MMTLHFWFNNQSQVIFAEMRKTSGVREGMKGFCWGIGDDSGDQFFSNMLGLRFPLASTQIQNSQLDVRVWHSEEEALAQDVNLAVVSM